MFVLHQPFYHVSFGPFHLCMQECSLFLIHFRLFWPPSLVGCLFTPSTHTRALAHMHIHYLPDEQCLIRTLSFAPPFSFLHTPAFPSSPSLLSPFSAPLTTVVIHLMQHREIFEGFSPHISLFPLLLSSCG